MPKAKKKVTKKAKAAKAELPKEVEEVTKPEEEVVEKPVVDVHVNEEVGQKIVDGNDQTNDGIVQ